MLGLSFSSKLDRSFYIVSIAKNSFKKIGGFIHSIKFFSDEVSLYICKSNIWPCMEYCSQIWLGAPSYYSDIIDKLQKRVCRTVGLTHTVFLESLGHQRNVASSIFFCWYYFGICSSELAELVPLPFSVRRYMHYFDSLHDISVALRECYINFYVNIVFLRAARL